MLSSSSSSANVFRSSLLKRSAQSLLWNRNHTCYVHFLSAESSSPGQTSSTESEPPQNRDSGFAPLMSLMSNVRMHQNTPAASGEPGSESSHFSTARAGSRSLGPTLLVAQRSTAIAKGRRSHKTVKARSKPAHKGPGAGKVAKRKVKADMKTLRELMRASLENGESTGLEPESWKEDWGEDELKPTSEDIAVQKRSSRKLPSYVRRIEGLIGHSNKDVLEEIVPPTGKAPIATLAHGLERVLFNPGVHWVQDPRSRVYNFTPFIQNIPDIKDFDFGRLSPFVRSSRDTVMHDLAIAQGKRFAGSTSSLSGLLCHIYFLLSQDREVDLTSLPEPFLSATRNFTPAQRMPAAVLFNHRDGVYLIDSDSTDNDDGQLNILMWMGTMLENFFTLPKDEFNKLLQSVSPENTLKNQPQAYRYSQSKSFVMRSQLDCVDPRLPGSGVFDIKTRAALPLRLDNLNFKENSGYLIKSQHGFLNSFDKEYYDLIRSAFLKYSFQVRIGGMDGIFLAYHNTARVFGFQYVPLEELDERLFGDYKYKRTVEAASSPHVSGTELGWRVFNKCISMLEAIAVEIVDCFPGQTVTCLAETRPGTNTMHVWIQPVDEARVEGTEDEEIPIVKTESDKPIIQLDITARSYLGGARAGGSDAVFLSRRPWTVHWSICRSSLPERAIKQHLAAAKKRKYRSKAYPTGVNAENLEEFIKNLGFGNIEGLPDATNFKEPTSAIKLLRRISRLGHLETQRLQSQDETKGIRVLHHVELIGPSSLPSGNSKA